METVLFVPGFDEDLHSRNYSAVLKAIEAKGYKTKFVPVTWQRKTITDWLAELEQAYSAYDPKHTVLAGFSYGAITSCVAASRREPSELWLFSLSPYFAEDLPQLPKSWLTKIGHRRVSSFQKLSFTSLASSIKCPVKLFAGEQELQKWSVTKGMFEAASKAFVNCQAIVVPNAGHEVEHPDYIAAIKESI